MQTLGLVAPVLGFYHRFLRFFIRFILLMFMDIPSTFNFLTQLTELGCGFLLLGYVSRIFNILGLLLIFLSCLRFLRSPIGKPPREENLKEEIENNNNSSSGGSGSREENLEDEMFDVVSLRKMVKSERQRFNAACAEIEKERGAAASAAEEAMAMILRLQSEKSAVEIQATQFRRVVEQKQEYDLEVIESLQWTVEQVESQKNLLERQLGVLRERLRDFLNDHDIQQRVQEQDQEGEQDQEREQEKERDQEQEKEQDHEQEKEQEKEQDQEQEKEREKEQDEEREKEREEEREKEREKEQEKELEHEPEHEQGTASDVDLDLDLDLAVVDEDIERDEDADSGSGFLNFSVEYNDDLDAASSQNPSPTQTPQHL